MTSQRTALRSALSPAPAAGEVPDSTVVDTDDRDVLFAKNETVTKSLVDQTVAISTLSESGATATRSFDLVTPTVPVESGDLPEIACAGLGPTGWRISSRH